MDVRRDPEAAQVARRLRLDTLAVDERLSGQAPGDPEARWGLAKARHQVGVLRAEAGEVAEAEATSRAADALLAELASGSPGHPAYAAERSALLGHWGTLLLRTSGRRVPEARGLLRRALEIERRLIAERPDEPGTRRRLARACLDLGSALAAVREPEASEKEGLLREALEILGLLADDSPEGVTDLAEAHAALSELCMATGRPEEAGREAAAVVAAAETLAARHRRDAERRHKVALLYSRLCRPFCRVLGAAEQVAEERSHRRAIDAWSRLAADFPAVPDFRAGLAAAQAASAASL